MKSIYKVLLYLMLFVSLINTSSAEPNPAAGGALNGYVSDSTSGETLIGAAIYIPKLNLGAYTNKSGYFALNNIPEGRYKVRVSYLGFNKLEMELVFKKNQKIRKDFILVPIDIKTEDVVVTAERDIEKRQITISKVNIPVSQIKEIRIGGESDIFRSIQMLPGVLTSSQISSGLYIRGGSPDQNLVLLDGSTVYNPTHLFGFISAFNSEVVKDVEIIKGGYPAEFGSRLSSVLTITQKDGNRNEFNGLASIGTLTSKLSMEGPTLWDGGSWFVGGRRTYFDLLMPFLDTDPENPMPDFGFYDLNGKITQDFGKNDRVSLSGFLSNDNFIMDMSGMDMSMLMGNKTGSLLWRHIFNEDLFMVTNLTGSFYTSGFSQELSGFEMNVENSITDYTMKSNLEWFASDKLTAKAGVEITNYIFKYLQDFSGDGEDAEEGTADGGAKMNLIEPDWNYSVFAQANYLFDMGLSLQAGLRTSYWDRSRKTNWDPRLGARYEFNEDFAMKATWGVFHQYLRLAGVENFSMMDTWLPTDNSVVPSYAEHYIISTETKPFDNTELSFDMYYKKLYNISEMNMTKVEGTTVADIFYNGNGESFGFEVFLQKKMGKLTGWLGYGYGFVNVRFDDINHGKWFRPKYDRRHDFKIVAQYNINDTWDVGGSFTFQSGQSYTQTTSRFQIQFPGMNYGIPRTIDGDRYNLRLPPSHQLNLNASYKYKMFGLESRLIIDIYNVYSRRDILMRYYNVTESNAEVEDILLLPIIPSITTEIKF